MKKLLVVCLVAIGLTACAREPVNDYSYSGSNYQPVYMGSSSHYQPVYTGPRGGKYTITSSGKKRYLSSKRK